MPLCTRKRGFVVSQIRFEDVVVGIMKQVCQVSVSTSLKRNSIDRFQYGFSALTRAAAQPLNEKKLCG